MKTQHIHLLTITILMSLIAATGTSQVPRQAYAAASGISDKDSCLALPAKAMAGWDEQGHRCAIQGTLEIRAGDILDVAPGVTLVVEQKGRIENSRGTISVSPGATLMVNGRLENAAGATLANSGNVAIAGALVNGGIIASSAEGILKNSGRVSNRGGMIINGAGSILLNEARMASGGATINSMGTVNNRGIMSMMHGSVLAGGGAAAGAKAGPVENTGRLVLYCNSFVTAAVSGNQPVDRCDHPPSATMYAFVPAQGSSGDDAFTFYANATDDRCVTQLEWDFDGDGVPDYLQQVQPPGRSADMWVSHRYEREGVYRPQVRAVDSAGAVSPWNAYGGQGKELDVVIPAAAGADKLLQQQQEKPQNQEQEQMQEKNGKEMLLPAAGDNTTSIVSPHAAPVASGLEVTGRQGLPVQVLLNATDADGGRLTFYVTSKPAHGTLSGQAPELTYIPSQEYVGKDSFTFVASDGTLQSKPDKVSITITPQSTPGNQTAPLAVVVPPADAGAVNGNDEKKAEKEADVDEDKIGNNNNNNSNVPGAPGQQQPNLRPPGNAGGNGTAPVAEGQTVATSQGTAAEIWLSAFDADGDMLQFQVTSQPAHGRLSGSAPVLTYTPDAGY